ncbi:hypothetical protein ACP70R_036860 [Stipagrostis hirtigluma subsp. patula]
MSWSLKGNILNRCRIGWSLKIWRTKPFPFLRRSREARAVVPAWGSPWPRRRRPCGPSSQHAAAATAASLLARRPRRAAATLRHPAGRSWDVDLDRDDGGGHHRVSFAGQGWRGFVLVNGVSAGHLLVFEHRGGLDFAVDLFDASGCLRDDISADEHHAAVDPPLPRSRCRSASRRRRRAGRGWIRPGRCGGAARPRRTGMAAA